MNVPAPDSAAPARLGHAHLRVADLAASVGFYLLLPGFRVSEWIPGRYAFLTGGHSHHELAFQQAPGRPGRGSLYHLAFELAGPMALAAARARFRSAGFGSDLVDHGISDAAYLRDPDRNGVELYANQRQASGIDTWAGRTRPLGDPHENRPDPAPRRASATPAAARVAARASS